MSDNLGVDLKAPRAFPDGVVASPTLGKLFEALAKAQAEFGIAVFDSKNPHFKNEFASIRSIDDATKKQLTKVGICVTQHLHSVAGVPHLFTLMGHSSGEFLGGDVELILSKRDMQGLGSANSYARRYAKSGAVGVVSDKDDDGEAAVGRGHNEGEREVSQFEAPVDFRRQAAQRKASPAQINMLKAKSKAMKMTEDNLIEIVRESCGVTDLREIPFEAVNVVVHALDNRV